MSGLDKNSNVTVVIPAAGFGKRVGSPEAKEMLIGEDNLPLIEFALKQAELIQARIALVTRPEKKSLLTYLEKHPYFSANGKIVFVRQTSEWPESVLESKKHWSDKNLLILPDTRWQPLGITKKLIDKLNDFELCYAAHDVEDLSRWGSFHIKDGFSYVCEKSLSGAGEAWGLIAFHANIGDELFKKQLQSTLGENDVRLSDIKITKLKLENFSDVTR